MDYLPTDHEKLELWIFRQNVGNYFKLKRDETYVGQTEHIYRLNLVHVLLVCNLSLEGLDPLKFLPVLPNGPLRKCCILADLRTCCPWAWDSVCICWAGLCAPSNLCLNLVS